MPSTGNWVRDSSRSFKFHNEELGDVLYNVLLSMALYLEIALDELLNFLSKRW
jgi:NTP pyrophosphatase (non-canonical NTP hydrolase)